MFAGIGALYRYVYEHRDDPRRQVRALPGPVRSELLLLASLAPIMDTNIRAAVDETLKVTDSSLSGACAVSVKLPHHAALELWRHRLGPGRYGKLDTVAGHCRGDSFVGELLEGSAVTELLKFRYRGPAVSINVGEARARRALWRTLAADATNHSRRHLIAYDSRVVLAVAAKGRADGDRLLKELRLTYPHLIGSDADEGGLWTDSERNAADSGSRGGSVPVPAPQRAWVHRFLSGDALALKARTTGPPTPNAVPEDRLQVFLADELAKIDRWSEEIAAK